MSSMIRWIGASLMGVALVAAGLGLGSSAEPTAVAQMVPAPYYAENELPGYPNTLEFPLGDALAVNGLPVRLSHFSTKDPALRVRDFYVDFFAAQGAPHKVIPTTDGGFTVAGLVAGGKAQAVVVISPRKLTTEVFPSVIPMSGETYGSLTPEDDIPFSNSAVGMTRVADHGQGGAEVVNYHEPLMSVREVAAHIDGAMIRKGWQGIESSALGKKGAQAVYTRGGQRVRFAITPYSFEPKGAAVTAHYGSEEQP